MFRTKQLKQTKQTNQSQTNQINQLQLVDKLPKENNHMFLKYDIKKEDYPECNCLMCKVINQQYYVGGCS
jgi:hypothetical protein